MWIPSLKLARLAAVAAVFSLPAWAAGAESAAPPADAEPAVWTPKELTFVYQGFTSHYSCDGLREKMRQVLLTLGAREDLEVWPYGCTSPAGRPDPFPGVRIKMSVLNPVSGAPAAAATVPAQWKKVDVRLNRDPVNEAGDCELLEQVKQKILPQFTTRHVDFSSNCVPHQLSTGGNWLRAEVLTAPQKDDKAPASK
jgi:hypothetical protein